MTNESASTTAKPKIRPIYAVFEGGGARGITHVGALKALEQEGLTPVGVAGSSAGAIIAALVAVGYKADELYRITGEDQGTDIVVRSKRAPVDVLGRGSWNRFKRMKPLSRLAGLLLIAAIVALIAAPLIGNSTIGYVAIGMLAAACGLAAWLLWPIVANRGMFSTDGMVDFLNEVLREKVGQHYDELGIDRAKLPRRIRFGDIDPSKLPQCIRLKITVSNVVTGGLEIFDQNRPDVVVADAVAASASIPLAFIPRKVEGASSDAGAIYVDGGLVSNLPAWSFAAEKRAFERRTDGPPVPVIAITLSDPKQHGHAKPGKGDGGFLAFASRVVRTGIFGSQKIVEDFVPDLEVIDLPSPLGTLDFDCGRAGANLAYLAGLHGAEQILRKRRWTRDGTEAALAHVHRAVEGLIHERRRQAGAEPPKIRASIVDEIGRWDLAANGRNSKIGFRIVASVGMADDADDRMEFDRENCLAPRAYATKSGFARVLRGVPLADFVMTKYERAMIASSAHSVICVPVLNSLVPEAPAERIFCIDSTDNLEDDFKDPIFRDAVFRESVILSPSLIAKRIEELTNG